MSTPHPDDTERDPWLAEALRHAPDAQAAPPAALSDAILRKARAAANAARAPQPVPARSRWLAVWDALARPSVAAGFASVMVATVVGVMWWGQPMDPTIARAPAVDATPPAAVSAAPPAAATAPPQPEAPQAVPAPDELGRAAARPQPDAASLQKRAAPKPAPQGGEVTTAQRAAPAPAPAAAPAPAQDREGPAPFTDRRVAGDATAAAPTAPPPAAAAPAPPAALALRAREPETSAAADSKAEAARDESRAMTGVGALAGSAAPKAAAPAAQRSDNVAGTRPAALNALLASVAAQPERWGWERGGTVQPITPALQRWLARLDAATAATRTRPAADSASSGEAAVLRLYRDGALSATLRLDDETVGLVPGARAALPPGTVAALKQALDDATR